MDLFNDNQQETRAVPPVSAGNEVKTTRQRRTERYAGVTEEAVRQPVEEIPAQKMEETPVQGTRITPKVDGGTRTQTRIPAPENAEIISQGIPCPAALSGQRPRREQAEQPASATAVRRPVQAEGYAPLQQLGTTSRARRPEVEYPARGEAPRRPRSPETERVGYELEQQEEEKGSGRGLIAVIIALLIVAALIIGLMMIPEDEPGMLGDVKRAVTAPIKNLFADDEEDEKKLSVTASGFTATVSQATAPYKVVFHMVTSTGVTQVRVVDAEGAVIPTKTTLSTPSSENAVIWMFEMLMEGSYSGDVQAQVQNGDSWVDTGLWQTLELGGATPTVSTLPVASLTTDAPTSVPSATPTAVQQTVIPAAALTATLDIPGETPVVTATPTLAATATPTLVPTMAPTEAPTPEPTPEPTAEPTPEPTETPEPTPVVTPRLEATAHEKADPALIAETEIYKDGRKVKEYTRKEPMNMPAADDYPLRAFGVTTFRGNAFRQNAAQDTVKNPTGLSLEWTMEAGSAAGSSRNYYGIGWTGQPVIVKWAADIRRSMELDQARKDQKNLKEVIIAGMDGKIYFLDLQDGSVTRDAIDFGYPMRSTPSLNPLFFPTMTVGQYARKMKNGTSDNIGLYYYDLTNKKKLRMIDGIDRKLKRPYSENASGAFDTSALIDRTTNTLIAIGTNGLLYTEKLNMSMRVDQENGGLIFVFDDPTETVSMMSHTRKQRENGVAVESSLAMYGSYAYYADMDGILRCVDTTTMTTAWAVDTGDSVRAAIALDLVEDGDTNTLWLYTANLINSGRTKGDVTIRRFNAMTGEEDWAWAINCAKGKKKDVTFGKEVIPGAMASPVIGQNGLSDLVYFTISSVSDKGGKALGADAAIASVIVALEKETGKLVWHKAMEAYSYSSPVAVYDENGKGWIIQACSNGLITLMDGLTGETINTLQVNGVIEGSPAVYGDTMVIGTTGKDTSYIYGIKIN
nr:hypothetical protein [Clostridia bacterium]